MLSIGFWVQQHHAAGAHRLFVAEQMAGDSHFQTVVFAFVNGNGIVADGMFLKEVNIEP